jgi:capsule polysaccharide export protein KpsE/RkpR
MSTQLESMPMIPDASPSAAARPGSAPAPNWLTNAQVLWRHRVFLSCLAVTALVVTFGLVFLIPMQYQSTARIMPPEQTGSEATMFAALAGRALGGDALGGLAASLLGTHTSGALFVELLRSGSVTGGIIDRYQLQSVYHTRYRVDTAKSLLHRTTIAQDKKSGVITVTVTDTNPRRARDLAQAYLDELNVLMTRTGTSSARKERVFIEHRLQAVQRDLDRAQLAMSDFSSTHATLDIREQTRATVDAAAKLQAELIVTQGELQSLEQIYGDQNVRVRAAEARLANLKREISKLGGSSAELASESDRLTGGSAAADPEPASYPPLRQLPRLAVPFANLYRSVRVQENIFELLTQQYEVARIQEAKDIPVVNVIDAPGIPEKKSFPPRKLLTLIMTMMVMAAASAWLIVRNHWRNLDPQDPRRVFADEILTTLNPKRYWPLRTLRRPA